MLPTKIIQKHVKSFKYIFISSKDVDAGPIF